MDINALIGKRLAQLVGPDKREDFVGDMGWQSQTYYEARIGRRVFRVSELAAMARASGKPAWQFVDARGLAKSVSLGADLGVIGSDALLDLFGYTRGEVVTWQALNWIREGLGDLNGAVLRARHAEKALRAAHPSLPAYEWEEEL